MQLSKSYEDVFKKGEGVRNYKQPKRNAYKIDNNNTYGVLMIDVDKLMNEMIVNAYRNGKLIYSANGDKSLINLLTKRHNPKTKYTKYAIKILNDLNLLANIPKHKSSGKSKMIGSSVMYYNDPSKLAERIKILTASIIAGNKSKFIKHDLSQINDELLRIGAIDKNIHEQLYRKYVI